MIYLLAILLLISALSKAVQDTIKDNLDTSVFKAWKGNQFWDERIAFLGKYKNRDKSQGPAFFGSETFLVFLTSGWHLMQHIFLLTLFVAFPIYAFIHPIISWLWFVTDFALIYAYFTCMFSLFYWIFNRK